MPGATFTRHSSQGSGRFETVSPAIQTRTTKPAWGSDLRWPRLWVRLRTFRVSEDRLPGAELERRTQGFLRATFPRLTHLRPGGWHVRAGSAISHFEQYSHLEALEQAAEANAELAAALGTDYTIKPDIIITREPEPDERINQNETFVVPGLARFTPLRRENTELELLHASVSCKWTIRSDRTQNSRAEALNLLRNRKGRAPHIAVVTAEPLPSRLASIAIGTGDIDCTYHVALHELQDVVSAEHWPNAHDKLSIMVDGKRLRDISDLPFDLTI